MGYHTDNASAKLLRFPKEPSNARDELNLCEFPLALLSDRAPKDCLELTFSDSVWDSTTKQQVGRTLHVSAPPKYGLPTAKDEEVLLALIHLTDQVNQFSEPTVSFTRYELLRMLGWNDGGKSYRRISESLARWKSVTLDYRNAWRDHRAKSWVSEVFSIIDNVTLYDVDQRRLDRREDGQFDLPLSSFTWNRVFFESMQAKFYKRLDFGFYLQLRTPTAKRLFRFLDKRFGAGRPVWDFELREFAFEHVGLSRNYDVGKIKEKLGPAILELEQQSYLVPASKEKRYFKRGKEWHVRFARATAAPVKKTPPIGCRLAQQLTERGVSAQTADELVSQCDNTTIREHIEVFDWIVGESVQELRNPGGYLAASIRSGFAVPAGFQTKAEREQAKALQEQRDADRRNQQAGRRLQQQSRQDMQDKIANERASLSVDRLQELERSAVEKASDEDKKVLAHPEFGSFHLQLLVDQLIADQLSTGALKASA